MAADFKVDLKGAHLKVTPSDKKLGRNGDPQLIKWQLGDTLDGGKFVGLTWIGAAPAPGIFGAFTDLPGKGWATMSDLHTGAATTSPDEGWVYQLAVEVNGKSYVTEPSTHAEAGGTPNIKNN